MYSQRIIKKQIEEAFDGRNMINFAQKKFVQISLRKTEIILFIVDWIHLTIL